MTDVFLVTKDSHPYVFKAFELISHDCGRQAGHKNYAVPLSYQPKIEQIETDLAEMFMEGDLLLELFCTGEESESTDIRKKYPEADELMQRFFEEFR